MDKVFSKAEVVSKNSDNCRRFCHRKNHTSENFSSWTTTDIEAREKDLAPLRDRMRVLRQEQDSIQSLKLVP
jgi:hypothetical protein